MIHHLAPNGKIGLVLANGALSTQSSDKGEIRKNIIEADLVEGIVAMPTQLFYSITIPVTLWFISKNKKQKGKTLFIDARKMGYMVDRKHRDFADEDIQKLADTFKAFQDGTLEKVKGFSAACDIQAIAAQDYMLTLGRYVGIEEQRDDSEPFDEKMKRLTSELSDMFAMLTNEQAIEEMLNLAKQIREAKEAGEELGLTADEIAFYDTLTKPQAIKDFHENKELIAITKELAGKLRKNRTVNWQKRDSARAKMRMMIRKLLKDHHYPPEGMDDAVTMVMSQCELWADNNI